MRFAVIVLLPLAAGHPAWAAGTDSCFFGNGSVTKQVAGFQTKISPYHHKDFPHEGCRAVVRDQNRKVVFSEHDFGFSIALLGEDVNGDGVPDVVLEAYSGGAHCCWTYYIISLGQKPGLLKAFGNQLGTRFAHNEKTGRIEISTWDGAFDSFDGLCYPCSPFPQVYLRLDGTTLVDISLQHVTDYDKTIGETQKALTPAELQRLRALKESPSDAEGASATVSKVLTIVVAYLYSGREAALPRSLLKSSSDSLT
jgi:hypothetical protein